MKRRAWMSLALLVGAGAISASATGAPAPSKKLDLTSSEKLKLIQQATKITPSGLEAAVRLSARKTYVAGQADITINNAPRVDPVRDEINLHSTSAGYLPHRINLRFKPSKAGQTVLIDVAVQSSTSGIAKVRLSEPGGQRSELTLPKGGGLGHVTLVARPTTTAWQNFYFGVDDGNVLVKYVEVTPAK